MSYSKRALHDYITIGKKFFCAPSMLLNFFRVLINDLKLNKSLSDTSMPTYTLRVVGKIKKNHSLYIRIQIIGTRAIFELPIAHLYCAREILIQIDPFNLINIGYQYKGCELTSSMQEKCNAQTDNFLIKKLSAYAKKKDVSKPYHFRIISHTLRWDNLFVTVKILNSLTTFDIPIQELEKDFFLLCNIEPSDLIRIGYIVKEEEIITNVSYLCGGEN